MILEELEDEKKSDELKKEIMAEWTYLALDEAQDWYQEERDIILKLFPIENIFVAVGEDQLLRSPKLTNWKGQAKIKGVETHIVQDTVSLRMTNNLTSFNNHLSSRFNLDWSVGKNKDLTGGEIYMFDDLNEEIVNSFTSELSYHKGSYEPVDYLIMNSKATSLRK